MPPSERARGAPPVSVILQPDGRARLATAHVLPGGRLLADALVFDAANLGWLADTLEAWHAAQGSDVVHTRGDDELSFRYGGADREPQVTIVHRRAEGSSIAFAADAVDAIVAALRAAARA